MVGCVLLVIGFGSSAALGAAYGVSVTGTMTITTILFAVLARQRWGWTMGRVAAVAGGFLVIDLAFLFANLVKIAHGGWVPLVIAAGLFLMMTTWNRGHRAAQSMAGQRDVLPFAQFLQEVERQAPPRVPGTAVFLTTHVDGAPLVLQRHVKYNRRSTRS